MAPDIGAIIFLDNCAICNNVTDNINRHKGNCQFEIMEAKNTKLSVGDTFRCHLMLQHEPLYLDEVVHLGQPAVVYVAGQRDGVVVEVCE